MAAVTTTSFAQAWSEEFDNIGGATSNGQLAGANLEANGWFLQNNSGGTGLTDWFQGNTGVFPQNSGTGYIGANFNNASGLNTISNWLVTPTRTLNNNDTLTFFTRTVGAPAFPDRLQVRMSTSGTSTNVGTLPTDVGAFTVLLLDINSGYSTSGYPTAWTSFTATVTGLSGPTSGRLAFRYFVENGGPSGANSDYIGIDTASYTPVPEPATMIALGAGALGLIARRRRKA